MFHQLLRMPEQGTSFSLSGRDGDSNRLYPARKTPNTHPYERTLAHVDHRSLHLAVSLDRFAKLMVLHPHKTCPFSL
jgi:hypothetical protein